MRTTTIFVGTVPPPNTAPTTQVRPRRAIGVSWKMEVTYRVLCTKRLKALDFLPLSKKFEYTDLLVFYRIFHNLSVNKLPLYLKPLDEEDTLSRLRPFINPPTHMTCQDGIHKLSANLEGISGSILLEH